MELRIFKGLADKIKNMKTENKVFCTFLAVHFGGNLLGISRGFWDS